MKKILISLMAVALVIGMVGVGVAAFFSDTETSTGNSFAAGTLNLTYNLDGGASIDGGNASFAEANKKPGDSGFHTFKVNNTGTIAGATLTVAVALSGDDDNVVTEPEVGSAGEDGGAIGELDNNLLVELFVDNGTGGGIANNGIKDGTELSLYSGLLSGIGGPYAIPGGLGAGGFNYVSLTWSIPIAVGNAVQSDSIVVGFTFSLTQ